MREYVLEMKNIYKSFPGVQALDNVSLECRKGEVVALVGENGAGKSTLMKVLGGVYQPEYGEIILNKKKVTIHTPQQAQSLGVSIIYQEFNLIPTLNIAGNIYLGREPHRGIFINWRYLYHEAEKLLANLGIELNPKTPVSELGIAQQQMVEIVKALSLDADILVMDEPSAALTLHELDNLFDRIRILQGSLQSGFE